MSAPRTVAAAGPAIVAPGSTPAGAPQNEDWNDVSHINGTVVPVGTRNEYVYRFRHTNIATNPIGWIFGFYGVSSSFALTDHVAVRGDINYIKMPRSEYSTFELGVGLPIYLRRTYQGPFVEPGVLLRDTQCGNIDRPSCAGGEDSDVGPVVMFGWHWSYDSGFNVAIAFGGGRDTADEDEVFPAGYFRIGYAF